MEVCSMNLRAYSVVVWLIAGVVLVLSLPAAARGGIADRAQEPSLFDLSIIELMNVEINVVPAVVQQSYPPRVKSLEADTSVNTQEMVQAAPSQDAAEPGIPSLPVRQPAKSDVR
jgi:hypothetical protein